MKKKLLFTGINMNCGGTEKSFLSFVNCVDFDKYDVDLVLARKDGLFMPLIPKEVNVYVMEEYSEMFFLSSQNAKKLLMDTFVKKNIFDAFVIAPYYILSLLDSKRRAEYAIRMWVKLSKRLKSFNPDTVYDAAFAYWGDRSMFYMVDKVKAKKKIAWLHFDYNFPKRDDKTYLKYFKKCDAIINVSKAVDDSLKAAFPEIANKCHIIENINSRKLIYEMAQTGDTFTDDFDGVRILTAGRIAPQKGYDFAAKALCKLLKDGYNVKWYALGDGDEKDKEVIKDILAKENALDSFVFLGSSVNPYGYMQNCDIYAQPSRFEGKPIAVEEAKILAKPILVSEYLSANEQLDNGRYGIVAKIDADDIYQKLKMLIDDKSLRESYSETLKKEISGNESEFLKILPLID